MLAFANVVNLLADEFSGLCARKFALALGLRSMTPSVVHVSFIDSGEQSAASCASDLDCVGIVGKAELSASIM